MYSGDLLNFIYCLKIECYYFSWCCNHRSLTIITIACYGGGNDYVWPIFHWTDSTLGIDAHLWFLLQGLILTRSCSWWRILYQTQLQRYKSANIPFSYHWKPFLFEIIFNNIDTFVPLEPRYFSLVLSAIVSNKISINQLQVASSVVSTILILNYHHRSADTHEMSDWVNAKFKKFHKLKKKKKLKKFVHTKSLVWLIINYIEQESYATYAHGIPF